MTSVGGIPFVRAEGDPFQAGYLHGAARAEALRAFLDDGVCRLNHVMRAPVSMESLQPLLAAYDAEIATATPALAEEIGGLAQGAGIGREQALLLQLRREIMGYSKVPTMGDCTTYARSGAGWDAAQVLAQTIDLNGDLDDQITVLEIARTGSSRRALVLSFGGLLGYLGLNSDGLAIGLNLVLAGAWRPGLPPYLVIRHLLDTAASVDQAVDLLRGMRLASSRSLTLCDATKTACVEILDDDLRLIETREPLHTNHFLHPDLAARDELNVFARNSSLLRLKACQARLAALAPGAGVEDHFALLSAAPIRVADTGDIRRERTVAAVVMLPDRGELHVRPGDPSLTGTQSFAL
jgi:isopenicillin-N N-acyltransferase like protein